MWYPSWGQVTHHCWGPAYSVSRDTVTKTDLPLIVSLARQAGETFCELYLLTGHGRPVFPIARNPMRKPH